MKKFTKVGNFKIVEGSNRRDRLTGVGLEVVYGGGGNDRLTGINTVISKIDGRILTGGERSGNILATPILSGGDGDDQYDIRKRQITFIADAGGGKDFVNAKAMNFKNTKFTRVNKRDIWAFDRSSDTVFHVFDPQGTLSSKNRIERFNIGGKNMSLKQFMNRATRSSAFEGDTTYRDAQRSGAFNLTGLGLDPSRMDNLIQALIKNNSIIG
jgi:hypothetical protein